MIALDPEPGRLLIDRAVVRIVVWNVISVLPSPSSVSVTVPTAPPSRSSANTSRSGSRTSR